MIIDVSHASDETFWDVLEATRAPILATHSSARAPPTPRATLPTTSSALSPKTTGPSWSTSTPASSTKTFVTIRQPTLKSERSGFHRTLEAELPPATSLFPSPPRTLSTVHSPPRVPRPPLSSLIDHIDHIAKIAGINHVGIAPTSTASLPQFDGIDSRR